MNEPIWDKIRKLLGLRVCYKCHARFKNENDPIIQVCRACHIKTVQEISEFMAPAHKLRFQMEYGPKGWPIPEAILDRIGPVTGAGVSRRK